MRWSRPTRLCRFDGRHAFDANETMIVLNRDVLWEDHLRSLETLANTASTLYVLVFDPRGYWKATCVPKRVGSFDNRLPFPERWRGLRDSDLIRECGVPGSLFVHANGFLATNVTLNGAVAMCTASQQSATRCLINVV